jgi:hypothetical protein
MRKPKVFKVAKCDLKRTTHIQQQILIVRGQRVMMDADLAKLYGVSTKRLNEQLKRNAKRFPTDFAFQLTLEEAKQLLRLSSQFVTLKRGQHIKHPPHVFTEHGAIMLASVLNSRIAIQTSIYVVRAFVQMRAAVQEYAELSRRIDELATNCDDQFQEIFDAIRQLMALPTKPDRPIGFVPASRKRLKERK